MHIDPHDDARRSMVALARQLGDPSRAWAILAEGNCSTAIDEDTFLVKASGAVMSVARDEDFVAVSLRAMHELIDDVAADDTAVAAAFARAASADAHGRRPSVETLLHAVCLALPGVTTVGHTHPTMVNSLLCSSRASSLVDGALIPDQIVVLGSRPLLVPYFDPGLTLAREVKRMLAEAETPRVIYLRNHGMFALGSSAEEVLQITAMAEKMAAILATAWSVGEPVFMSAEDVTRIDTRPDELLRREALAAR